MDKKTYIKPGSTVIDMSDLMEGSGPVKNSGKGYKFNNDPADGNDLEGKGNVWDDEDKGVWGMTFPVDNGKVWKDWK